MTLWLNEVLPPRMYTMLNETGVNVDVAKLHNLRRRELRPSTTPPVGTR